MASRLIAMVSAMGLSTSLFDMSHFVIERNRRPLLL